MTVEPPSAAASGRARISRNARVLDTIAQNVETEQNFAVISGRMLRAVRYARRLSQRELAELAQVRRETVVRIEADRVVPRVDTLSTVLRGGGFSLGLLDHRGRFFGLHPHRDALLDRAGRHLPAHLHPVRTPSYAAPVGGGYWWGWHHIAWPFSDDWVPEHTYWRRPAPRPLLDPGGGWVCGPRVWDDAT